MDGVDGPVAEDGDQARRLALTVAYDGSGFHGFAAQPGLVTVEQVLTTTLGRVLRHPVDLSCAGRTDTGVHAWGQVVSLDTTAARTDLDHLVRSVNKLCAPAIVVRGARWVDDTFDARRSARSRRYRYTVLNRPVPDPFRAATSWWVARPLDVRAMILGCDPIIGEHDFASFCRRPKPVGAEVEHPPTTVRRVLDARWRDEGDGVLELWIEAQAFCHQMVRSLVGTLVDVGSGRLRAGEVAGILRARDRGRAGQVAPAHGLCLHEVRY